MTLWILCTLGFTGSSDAPISQGSPWVPAVRTPWHIQVLLLWGGGCPAARLGSLIAKGSFTLPELLYAFPFESTLFHWGNRTRKELPQPSPTTSSPVPAAVPVHSAAPPRIVEESSLCLSKAKPATWTIHPSPFYLPLLHLSPLSCIICLSPLLDNSHLVCKQARILLIFRSLLLMPHLPSSCSGRGTQKSSLQTAPCLPFSNFLLTPPPDTLLLESPVFSTLLNPMVHNQASPYLTH